MDDFFHGKSAGEHLHPHLPYGEPQPAAAACGGKDFGVDVEVGELVIAGVCGGGCEQACVRMKDAARTRQLLQAADAIPAGQRDGFMSVVAL